jgi:hypothetical protein
MRVAGVLHGRLYRSQVMPLVPCRVDLVTAVLNISGSLALSRLGVLPLPPASTLADLCSGVTGAARPRKQNTKRANRVIHYQNYFAITVNGQLLASRLPNALLGTSMNR